VVPVEDLVGPFDEGVHDVVELWELAGLVEVAEAVEGLQGALVVVGVVEASELLEGLPGGFESRVCVEDRVEAGPVCAGEGVGPFEQGEAGFEHLRVERWFGAPGLAALDVSAHRAVRPAENHLMTWKRSSTWRAWPRWVAMAER